jgi:hypothetical protein
MKLVSSYDNINDLADYRRRSATSARFAIDAAKTEITNIASEFVGIEGSIIDGMADQTDADYLTEDFLKSRLTKLSEAYRRLYHFKAELKEMGEEP